MTQAMVPAGEKLREVLDRPDTRSVIAEALPKTISVERFMRLAITAVRKNPALAECTPASFVGCLLQAAAVGLEPETPLGHAYLIPFKDNKSGTSECTLVLGYKGLIDLARRSGKVSSIYAEVVYAGDAFAWEMGMAPNVRHQRLVSAIVKHDSRSNRDLLTGENVTHAYAVAYVDGVPQVAVMPRVELDSIRSHSRSAYNGPWVTHPEEMMRKTVLRRLCKLLPLSPLDREAVEQEDRRDHITVISETGEIVDRVPPAVPPPPLDDCPVHRTPWRRGNQGGLYHDGGCTPARMLTDAAAEGRQWDKPTLDEYLKEVFGVTASRLEPGQVAEAYDTVMGSAVPETGGDGAAAPGGTGEGAEGGAAAQAAMPGAEETANPGGPFDQ